MIKAIIFDCFGVLTTDGWKHLRGQYCATDEMRLKAHQIDVAVNAGQINYEEFLQEIATLTGRTVDEVRDVLSENVPNTQLFDHITTELKPHYKIGMLSNAADNWLNELFGPEQVAVFDAVTLSYELAATKPDRVMYESIAEKLGVEVGECVFVDDIKTYCDGAESVGMKAIQYSTFEKLRTELGRVL